MTINARARDLTDRVVVPLARQLVRWGATPNGLTLGGLVLTVAGMAVVLGLSPFFGALVLTAGALTDALDGAVARQTNAASPLGSFYDSVGDRISDGILLGGAAWVVRGDPATFAAAMVALVGAQVTSYARAKAESLGWGATVGLVERPERVILLLFAFGLGFVRVAVWLLAVGAVVTVLQRLRVVVGQARVR